MDLKILQDDEQELWDSVVKQCEGATIFHTWKWLKIVESHSKKKVLISTIPATLHALLVSEKGAIIGLFPIFLYEHPIFRIVASPPSGVEDLYLGPLLCKMGDIPHGTQEHRLMQFFEIIDTYVKTLQPTMTLIHTAPASLDDVRPFKWAGYEVEPRYTYEVDLMTEKTCLWDSFSRVLKQRINKAKRIGISIEEGSKEDFGYIYDRLKERNHIHPEKQFFMEIFDNFYPAHLKIFIAKFEGKPISGIVTLIYREKMMFWVGLPRYSIEGISPNELIMWECINWAKDNGFKVWELMGADDVTLFVFKRKFNGTPTLYFTLRRFSPIMKIVECIYRVIKPRYSSLE